MATKRELAGTVWRGMSQFSMRRFQRAAGILQEMGLTPGHMKMLFLLEPSTARPMGALAQSMTCDASTATWLVDRLEEKGLAERQALPGDRRVKAVALTQAGIDMKQRLEARLYEPPEELVALDRGSLEMLARTIATLSDEPVG